MKNKKYRNISRQYNMHKYESYGSWEDCSDYWNNTNENDLIEIINDSFADKSIQTNTSNKQEIDNKSIIINKIKISTKK